DPEVSEKSIVLFWAVLKWSVQFDRATVIRNVGGRSCEREGLDSGGVTVLDDPRSPKQLVNLGVALAGRGCRFIGAWIYPGVSAIDSRVGRDRESITV
ncbi:MAG TPA: hypothetical protein VF772_03430, partial [Terriglobales bacterium]